MCKQTRAHIKKKKEKKTYSHTHRTNLTKTPITLHLVCDLIQCIDNLPVSGTQPTDHFHGTLLSAAPPPRWLGTQTSIQSTRRKEKSKWRRDLERAPDGVHWHTLQSPLAGYGERGMELRCEGRERRQGGEMQSVNWRRGRKTQMSILWKYMGSFNEISNAGGRNAFQGGKKTGKWEYKKGNLVRVIITHTVEKGKERHEMRK